MLKIQRKDHPVRRQMNFAVRSLLQGEYESVYWANEQKNGPLTISNKFMVGTLVKPQVPINIDRS